MSKVILEIKQWSNNLGVRLHSVITKAAHLHNHQKVDISVENDHVIITPLKSENLSLEQRLAQFDPNKHGGEVMNTVEISLVTGLPMTTAAYKAYTSFHLT